MTLIEHLGELRSRIIKMLIALAVGVTIGFVLYDPVLEILQRPYCEVSKECSFLVTDPLESLAIRLKVSTYVGFLVASPAIMWQLWRFITPGLHTKEKRWAIPFVATSVILFVLGAGLALWTFPQALTFFVQVGGDSLVTMYSPAKYLSLVTFLMLTFGLGFEFPIVLVFLQMAGMLSWKTLSSWRRYAAVVIVVLVAVITPSGDPFTLIALALPMYVFYECSILFGRFAIKSADR
ncbi:MAG: twin-arginine translocase subunit TatC [Acidimicrobiales bacterium]